MDKAQLKKFLQSRGLKPNVTYGQNFLIDDIVLQDIVDAAEVSKQDKVLEIGPGVGTLTELLCARAGFVLSIEKDPQFLPVLYGIKKNFRDNFRYEIADALEFDYIKAFSEEVLDETVQKKSGSATRYPLTASNYKVVANIPYYITGKILQMLLTAKHKPSSITVLTQKEVARNVIAKPGNLSILAISVQLFGEPRLVQIVPAKSFFPAPKVDSAVLQIHLFDKPRYEVGDEKKFFALLRACFSGKRKQIHNTLKNNLHLSTEQVEKVLSEANIKPTARPQELTIENWIALNTLVLKMQNSDEV